MAFALLMLGGGIAPATAQPYALEPPGEPPALPAASVPEYPKVSEVQVRLLPEGGHRVQVSAVRAKIKLSAGQTLDPGLVSDDIRRIYGMGFFDDIQVSITETSGGAVITFHLLERPVVGAMDFDGVDEDDDDIKPIVRRARARLDRFYDPDLINTVARDLRAHFESKGFYLVEIDVRTKRMSGNRIGVTYVVETHDKLSIRRVDIVGNHEVPDSEILPFLANQEGGLFSFLSTAGTYQRSLLFQRDVEVIRQIYGSKGYPFARVGTPTITLLADRSGLHITIPVVEGKKYTVSGVDISGEDLLAPKEELIDLTRMEVGQTFDIRTLFEDIQRLTHFYRDKGYAFADVAYRWKPDRKARTLAITYTVQKGSKVRIGRIEVTGNRRTLDDVVRREMRILEGEYYSEAGLKRSQARIERTGFFDKVQIRKKVRTLGDGTQVLDLEVHVRRRQTGSFQLGVGFSSFESFMFSAQIAEQNFLGRGQSLSFSALISSLRSIFSISFSEPYFFDTDVAFGFTLFNLTELFVDFERQRRGGTLTWGYRLTDDLSISGTFRLEHATTSLGGSGGRGSVPVARAFQSGITSSLQLRLSYDTRDDRIFPKHGQFTTLSWENANEVLGSEIDFNTYRFRTRWFFPFLLNTTLRFNGSYEYVQTTDPQGLPIFERLFAGGIFDIRGFERYSLGPELPVPRARDPGSGLRGFIFGGNKKLVFNAEIEMPILEAARITGVVFFDAGNTFGEGEQPTLETVRKSVGFGVRWWSPVGPLRFEWGFPLDLRPGEEPMVFEFTIGNAF